MEDLEELKQILTVLRIRKKITNKVFLDILAKSNGNVPVAIELVRKDFNEELKNENLEICKDLGVNVKFILEHDYPEKLRSISSPPIILFYKGKWDKSLFNKTISVVGTRKATDYGRLVTKSLVSDLVTEDFTIVSGLAFGIDKQAHDSALEFGGKTIAVTPCSPYKAIPANNIGTYNKILESGGLVISEYISDSTNMKGLFVSRNRIVAGLSDATLIVEAGETSGALLTAGYAFKFQRHLFAVPGNINSVNSAGTNKLIKERKARLVSSVDDILNGMNISKNNVHKTVDLMKSLTDNETKVYNAMEISSDINEISNNIDCDISVTLQTLVRLELKGLITLTEEGNYKK